MMLAAATATATSHNILAFDVVRRRVFYPFALLGFQWWRLAGIALGDLS